ncbi:MAG TPA: glycosyltransferase family 9 protein [Candidatus Limnocylindrales bacterium]|nr:glycosyltransferase family 9 protein [Candidatus Limnocylindrales bacterium]
MIDVTTEPIQTIALFRALKLGDMLVFVPALRALRAVYPKAHIAYIGLPWAREYANRYSQYIDEFIEFPGYPGLVEREYGAAAVLQFLGSMQQRKFDLVLQMHGSGQLSNPLACLFGGLRTAGFYVPGGFCPDSDTFMPYPDDKHEIHRHLELLNYVGIPDAGTDLEFPITEQDRSLIDALVPDKTRPYAVLHPGSVSGGRWPVERFAELGDWLADCGLQVVLTGSPAEAELADRVQSLMKEQALNACGKTELGPLAALLASSQLVVSNDTGVAHLAVAVDAPSITIFTTADPKRWAPLEHEWHPHLLLEDASAQNVKLLAEQLLTRSTS